MAFATAADLAARLGVTFTAAQEAQATALLGDATAYLQAELGQLIEAGTATYTTRWRGESPIHLPQQPVTVVSAVTVDGAALAAASFDFIDQELHLAHRRGITDFGERTPYVDVTVTFNYGYAVVPAELKGWTCILASQLMSAAAGGSLGIPSVQSHQIDDFSETFVTDGTTMSLPPVVLERLRARYGAGAYVTGVGRS